MVKKSYISIACALAISGACAADLGTISVESSTIDDKYESKQTEVSNTAVITAEEVEKINPQSVADILKKVPGLTMSLVGTDALKVHIRGVDNQMYMGERPGVAIVIDGVPVQETTGKINVDLDNIESIKVIKGGASYLYGNDAIAGAVIITTKRAKAQSSSKLEAELGSFNSKRYSISTNQALENSSLQLQGSLRNTDGYWDDAYVNIKSINGKYQYYIDEFSDITFGADITSRKTGDGNSVKGLSEAVLNPKSFGTYSYGGYYDSDLTKTFITYSKTFEDDSSMMLRVHKYVDDKTSKLNRKKYDNDEKWDQNGAKGEYKKSFGKVAVMVGFDLQRNNTDETQYLASNHTLRSAYETKEDINALYGELKYQITDKLTTTFNVRYDDIQQEYKDVLTPGNNVSPDYQTTSYRAGLNYMFNDNISLYSNISTGFRAPTVGQTSTNQVALAADPTLNIPAVMDEETTYNYEIGIRGKTDTINYDAAVFQLDREDYIGRIAGSYITSDDENESNYDNVGDMRSRGFEFSISSDRSKTFSYDLAYTFLQAKFKNYMISQQITPDTNPSYTISNATFARKDLSGNYVPRTSKHTISLGMNYRVNDKLTLSPEILVKSSYYADEANAFKQKGYEVANLNISYQYSKSLEFFGKIDNLFDTYYHEFVNINSSALATTEDATIRVAPPRAYYAGLRYRF